MTEALFQQIHRDQQAILRRRKRRLPRVLIIVTSLAGGTAAAVFFWLHFGSLVQAIPFFRENSATVTNGDNVGQAVTREDFVKFQQRTTGFLQSVAQDTAAQKIELNILSDQVARLATKIDEVQRAAAASMLLSTAAQPTISLRPTVASPGKTPANSSGRISIGGAPLPPASSEPDRRR